jgi:hypothetical protein
VHRARSGHPRVRSTPARAGVTLAVVVALLAVAGCRTYQATPSAWKLPVGYVKGPVVAGRAGIAPGVGILSESAAEETATLDAIAATGAGWTTLDIDWGAIQADGPLAYRWERTDRTVLNMHGRGLAVIGVIAYSPAWARGASCPPQEVHCLPANPADYARFAQAAAARYGTFASNPWLRGSVTHWQIWNEPNHQPYAQPKPSLGDYTALLKASYAAIKGADPAATVITGGTAPAPDAPDHTDYQPVTWLRGLYARGAKGSFDAVGHHPAAYPFNPLEPHDWNAYTQTLALHAVMTERGDGAKKVWGTEIGAPSGTADRALTEAKQAQWVHDYHLGWNTILAGLTGPLIWMPLRDAGTDLSAREQNMGLLRRDRSAKPSYSMYRWIMIAGV